MENFVLTAVDTAGIQSYIFGTNNLQQNIGASYLVKMATQNWALDILHGLKIATEIKAPDISSQLNKQPEINKDSTYLGEIVYCGGGNIIVIFRKRGTAEEFVKKLSLKALLEAPGLRVIAAHEEFDWGKTPLGGKGGSIYKVLGKLSKQKFNPPPSGEFTGLSVTAESSFKSLPVVGQDKDGHWLSEEARAKLNVKDAALKELVHFLDFKDTSDFYEFPNEFDNFGQLINTSNYIAVVHADGNNMGKRIEKIANDYNDPKQNRIYIKKIRLFSYEVNESALTATRNMINKLVANIQVNSEGVGYTIKNKLNIPFTDKKNKTLFLPIRPIVFGGDDLTFVCNGDLGLSLAAEYLKLLSQQTVSGKKVHCRAGVAIVKTHYPFSRAYSLAEQLLDSAKEFILEIDDDACVTALDWHFGTTGIVETNLDYIRNKEYSLGNITKNEEETGLLHKYYRKKGNPNLLMRPVQIQCKDIKKNEQLSEKEKETNWRNWENFNTITKGLQKIASERRNKIKALREHLRKGPDATENFTTLTKLHLPSLDNSCPDENYRKTGWFYNSIEGNPETEQNIDKNPKMGVGKDSRPLETGILLNHCVYFDSIEAIDHFIDLEMGDKKNDKL